MKTGAISEMTCQKSWPSLLLLDAPSSRWSSALWCTSFPVSKLPIPSGEKGERKGVYMCEKGGMREALVAK